MRRVLSGVMVTGMTVGGLLGLGGGVAGAQTGTTAAFCQARADAETSSQGAASGDKTAKAAFDDALTRIQANTPASLTTQVATIVNAIKSKGIEKAFNDPAVTAAGNAVDAFFAANCGYTVVKVTALDYQYSGLPATLKAGKMVFQFTNSAPVEKHEMILFKRKAGVTDTAAKLLALSQKKAAKKVDFVNATEADPGTTTYLLLPALDAGQYIVACYQPQGGKKNGKPHFKLGMVAEFTVS